MGQGVEPIETNRLVLRGFGFSMIRPENVQSRRVAEKNGLTVNRIVFWRDYDHCVYELWKK